MSKTAPICVKDVLLFPDLFCIVGCVLFLFYIQHLFPGAGYVLSREALRKFVEEAIPNPKKCRQDAGGAEDVEIGK